MLNLNAERLSGIVIGFAAVGALLTGWLVLVGYLAALAGAWVPGTRLGRGLFLFGAGAVTLIGAWFSFGQLTGALECPTFEGLPMCFVSLFTGVSMLVTDESRRRLVR